MLPVKAFLGNIFPVEWKLSLSMLMLFKISQWVLQKMGEQDWNGEVDFATLASTKPG